MKFCTFIKYYSFLNVGKDNILKLLKSIDANIAFKLKSSNTRHKLYKADSNNHAYHYHWFGVIPVTDAYLAFSDRSLFAYDEIVTYMYILSQFGFHI